MKTGFVESSSLERTLEKFEENTKGVNVTGWQVLERPLEFVIVYTYIDITSM